MLSVSGFAMSAGRVRPLDRPHFVAGDVQQRIEPAEKSRGSLSAGALAIPEHTPVTIAAECGMFISVSLRFRTRLAPRQACATTIFPLASLMSHIRSRAIE
jgi:hypothetical protein